MALKFVESLHCFTCEFIHNMVPTTNIYAVHLLTSHFVGLCALVDIVLGCLDGMSDCKDYDAKYQYLLASARHCVIDMTKLDKRGKVEVYNCKSNYLFYNSTYYNTYNYSHTYNYTYAHTYNYTYNYTHTYNYAYTHTYIYNYNYIYTHIYICN